MKPMPEYDSTYHCEYPQLRVSGCAMETMANDIIPLVVCLDGVSVSFGWNDIPSSWSHYQDVPPIQALERIEQLAQIIAEHYPTS